MDNILIIITIILTVTGLIIGLFQWYRTNNIKRTEFTNQILENLRNDKESVKILYGIENDKFEFDESFYNNFDFQYEIDKILSYLSYICYLREIKVIKKKEFVFAEYKINTIFKNNNTLAYLRYVYHWSKNENNSISSFDYLIKYGKKKKLFKKEFFDMPLDYNKEEIWDLYKSWLMD